MLILWFSAFFLPVAFGFSMIKITNIFLNENQKEQIIEYTGNVDESAINFYKWDITASTKHTIELYCNIYLYKTDNCTKGALIISDHGSIEEFCELNSLKWESVKNKVEIKLWKLRHNIGNFQCQVQLVRPYLKTTAEEIDHSGHDLNVGPVASTTCPCGWINKYKGRIVGGQETRINEYPFMVILVDRKRNKKICGGTIITPLHVLTAAHCQILPMSAIVGEHDFNQSDETNATVKIDVEYFIKHYKFSTSHLENDIAIAILKEEISFNKDVGPVCLPSKKPDLENQFVKALGWGVTDPDKRVSSDVLREVNLRVINTEKCSNYYNELRSNSRSQFCTYAWKKDTCQGDSGGPILWLDAEIKRYILAGLVSYGGKCATRAPGVNTDIAFFMDWIQLVVTVTSRKTKVCVKETY